MTISHNALATGDAARATVRELREERGWSQIELARRVRETGLEGIHQTTISRIEQGTRGIDIDELVHLAAALGVTIYRILTVPEAQSTAFEAGRTAERNAMTEFLAHRADGNGVL